MSSEQSVETLSLVIKADTAGTREAIISSVETLDTGDVTVEVAHSGTGDISKSDLLMAETAGRLVLGFNVDLLPRINELAAEKGVEIRLHNVIYKLLDDIKKIAKAMVVREEEERIKGRAKVIALFPGGRKGIILGCDVYEGALTRGSKFRLISDPGIVYSGIIDSLHIETRSVNKAATGQQVGLKISGFKRAKEGDLVECFEDLPPKGRGWHPRGTVYDLRTTG